MTKRREMAEMAAINNEWSTQKINLKNAREDNTNKEIQPRDHMRNDHGIKEPEESPKNAEDKPRQTDHTPG